MKTSDNLTDEQMRAALEVLAVSPMLSRADIVRRIVDIVWPANGWLGHTTEELRSARARTTELEAALAAVLAFAPTHSMHCRVFSRADGGGCSCLLAETLARARALLSAKGLECPVCARIAEVGVYINLVGESTYHVACTHAACGVRGPARSTRALAIEAWNALGVRT